MKSAVTEVVIGQMFRGAEIRDDEMIRGVAKALRSHHNVGKEASEEARTMSDDELVCVRRDRNKRGGILVIQHRQLGEEMALEKKSSRPRAQGSVRRAVSDAVGDGRMLDRSSVQFDASSDRSQINGHGHTSGASQTYLCKPRNLQHHRGAKQQQAWAHA